MQLAALVHRHFSACGNKFTPKIGRVMKLTTILLLITCLQVSAGVAGQTVTIRVKNAPMKEVFREIQKQTGLDVFVDEALLQKTGKVTLDVKNMPVPEVLDLCLKNEPLNYVIADGRIVIRSKPTAVFHSLDASSRPLLAAIDVKGTVYNESGQPLSGATVTVKGTGKGATTNENGIYYLKNIDENAILEVSFIGYETQSAEVKGRTNVSISLHLSANNLNEVVVNKGYYSTTRKLNTGNVASLNATQIANQPVNNPLLALAGRLPGVFVTQTSGLPGAGISILIRGRSSIGSGTDPLYIIDGVPYAPNVPLTTLASAAPGESPFISINPDDIESIDVLKDADATAIYGSRGANGVILITTKKAKAGNTGKVNVSTTIASGMGQVAKKARLMDLSQYLQMRKDAFANDSLAPTAANAPDLFLWDQNKITDWQDVFFGRTSHFTDVQAGVSSSSPLSSISFNSGYHDESTVYAPSDLGNKRFSTRLSTDLNSRDRRFNMNSAVEYAAEKNTLPRTDGTQNAYGLPPHFPLYNPDGTPNWKTSFVWPLAFLTESSIFKTQTIIGNTVLRYRLLPGLDIRSSFGYSRRSTDQMTLTPFAAQNPATATRNSTFANTYVESYIIEPQINYTYKKGRSEFSALAGGTLQQTRSWNQSFSASGFASDASLSNLQAAATITASNSSVHYRYNSLFGRFSYNWDEKYLVNLTVRRDGSSRFGPGNRFGNFGALGVGWIFSKEPFIEKNLSFLSFGKIRGSYGLTGNDQIGDYRYLTTFGSGTAYQGVGSLQPNRVVNEQYGWEVNHKLELATELGFFRDRITLSVSFYRNRSDNSLVNVPIPAITGFTSYQGNLPALVQNKGWEFLLNTTNIKSKSFTWTSSFNLSLNRNKLLTFPGIEKTTYANIYAVGSSLYRGKRLHSLGIDPKTGLAQFEDVSKDGTISFLTDGKFYDHDFNKYYGGLTNTFIYKNLQLDVSMDFVNKWGQTSFVNGIVGTAQNQYAVVSDYWRRSGDITNIPRPAVLPGSPGYNSFQNWSLSDAQFGNASYIKIRNAVLSYRFTSRLLEQYHISRLDLFVKGENLFSFSKFDALDPETGNFNMPPIRIITFGIHCQF